MRDIVRVYANMTYHIRCKVVLSGRGPRGRFHPCISGVDVGSSYRPPPPLGNHVAVGMAAVAMNCS